MEPITLEQIISFLLESPLFGDLDPTELSTIVHIMQIQRVRDGHPVFREGAEGDAWYVLFDGKLAVTKEGATEQGKVIATLDPRACFGEMAILDGSPRSATVLAVGDCVLFRFPREPFLSLLDEENLAAYKLIYQMARTLSQRQRELNQRLSDLSDAEPSQGRVIRRNIGELLDSLSVSE